MSKRIPLLEEVLKYQKEKNLILSMPGNKSGIGFLRDDIGKEFVNNMGFLDNKGSTRFISKNLWFKESVFCC